MNTTLLDPRSWHEISDHFDHALDLEPEARERWLCELESLEPSVSGKLRELLTELDSLNAHGFLESSALSLPNVLSPNLPSLAGKAIGAYTVERLLGRGGMGEVWLAARSDGRFEGRCAIKLLDSSVVQPRVTERFLHEGRLLARLTHPSIARLIDAGVTDEGRQYLALEYVDGEPVDRYCESRSLAMTARVRLFLDVAAAVAHAHANLVIHRDLKPSNVLVTGDGVVKLLDFGIATLMSVEAPADSDRTVTRYGDMALTPEYAAPEQLLGEQPSTATDVYQLGMLLYVMLTGRHPIRLPAGSSRAERVKASLEGQRPPASEFATGPARKQLRGDLDAILAMALRQEPTERYATVAAFRDDLSRYLTGEPVAARRGATLYHARKFMRRHRFAVWGSGVAVLCLCAALIFAFRQAGAADAERDRAYDLAARNEAVTEFMGTVISEAADADKPITVSDMLARSQELALADTSGNRETRAAVLESLAVQYQIVQDHPQAAQLLERALAILADSPDSDLRAEITCGHALVISSMGQKELSQREMLEQLAHMPADPKSAADCLHARALIAVQSDDGPAALRYALEALTRLHRVPRQFLPREVSFLETVASAYHVNGRHRESFEYYARALSVLEKLGREHGPMGLILRNNWAVSSEASGVPRQALELHDKSIQLLKARDSRGALPGFIVLNRARALEQVGRFQEAHTAYESALQLTSAGGSKYAPFYSLMGLAQTASVLGDVAGAVKYFERAKALIDSSEPADSIPSMRIAMMSGNLDISAGRFAAARDEFARAMKGKPNRPQSVDAAVGKAKADLLSGDAMAATQDARRALQTAQSIQGGVPYSDRTGKSWLILGLALKALGDVRGAHDAFDSAVTHLSNTVDANHPALIEARSYLDGSSKA